MGFFEDVGNGIKGAVSSVVRPVQTVGNAVSGIAGSGSYLLNPLQPIADWQNQQDNIDAAKRAEEEAAARAAESMRQINDIRDQQKRIYEQFGADAPLIQQGLLQSVNTDIKRNLASDIGRIKTNAASRGLLRSGFTDLGKAQARSAAKSDYAKRAYDITDQLEGQKRDLQNAYTQTGLQAAGLQGDAAQEYYRNALQNMQNQAGAYRALGQAGGQIAGSYLGRKSYNQSAGG